MLGRQLHHLGRLREHPVYEERGLFTKNDFFWIGRGRVVVLHRAALLARLVRHVVPLRVGAHLHAVHVAVQFVDCAARLVELLDLRHDGAVREIQVDRLRPVN